MADNTLSIAHAHAHDIRSLHSFIWDTDVIEELYRTYGDGMKNGVDILRSLGRFGTVGNDSFTHHEETYDLRTVKVASSGISVASNPGDSASFVLHADDLAQIDSTYYHYLREGFTLTFGSTADGFIEARITDVSESGSTITVTVEPYDATATLSSTYIYDGAEVAIGGGAFAVETDQPPATMTSFAERTHYTQIFKETITFGGHALASKSFHRDLEGGGLWNKEFSRAEFLLDRQLEYALVMGQANTNSLTQVSSVTGAANPISKTKGLWTWGTELGYTMNYTDSGGVDMSDFNDIAAYYESVGVNSGVVLVLCGGGYYRRMEDMGLKFLSNPSGAATQGGGLPGDFLAPARKGKHPFSLRFGFEAVQKSGITYVFYNLPIFNNPYMFGISGYMLNDAAIYVPLTDVKDPVKDLYIPNIRGVARGINGYSRERVVGSLAGMDGFLQQKIGNPTISSIDANNTYWLADVGFATMEAFKIVLHKRSA